MCADAQLLDVDTSKMETYEQHDWAQSVDLFAARAVRLGNAELAGLGQDLVDAFGDRSKVNVTELRVGVKTFVTTCRQLGYVA